MIDLFRTLRFPEEIDVVRGAFAAAHRGPSPDELASAPVLNAWQISHDNLVMFLAGVAEGHPRLGSAVITTSPLIALSADLTWARATSRFYRLGLFLKTDRETSPSEWGPYALPTLDISDARKLLAVMEERFRRKFH